MDSENRKNCHEQEANFEGINEMKYKRKRNAQQFWTSETSQNEEAEPNVCSEEQSDEKKQRRQITLALEKFAVNLLFVARF